MQTGRTRDQDNPHGPPHLRMREIDRDLIRGRHYGQRPSVPHSKAGHMAAPTTAATCLRSLTTRSRPHMAHCRKFVLFERYRDEAPCGHVERRRAALDLARLRRQWCVPALRFSSGATYLDRSCQRQLSLAPNAAGRLDGFAMCQARQNLRSSIHKSGWNSGFPMYTLNQASPIRRSPWLVNGPEEPRC